MANTWTSTPSAEWPADLQNASYLADGLCGEEPAVPQFRKNSHDPNGGSAHLDPNGNLVAPPNTTLPSMVPFDRRKYCEASYFINHQIRCPGIRDRFTAADSRSNAQ